MNFLAHIYLSGDDQELQIGNFIADSVKGKKYLHYPERIQDGIKLHRQIDSYTDHHPIVRQSISRLFPVYGHYSGVIVDIFYDHFLASLWQDYTTIPLDEYIATFYSLLQSHYEILPTRIQNFMPYMLSDNWLLSYARIDGIERILFQMDQRRTKHKSNMHLAVKELKEYYEDFKSEFRLFFIDLQLFTTEKIKTLA
ncbi:acyl carrier protein phosphodiesterase [Aquimarina rhabdastrellae]